MEDKRKAKHNDEKIFYDKDFFVEKKKLRDV